MLDASLGPLVTGVLLVIFGPIAVKILERVMGNAPTWVWRVLAFLCVAAGWTIVLLNDPMKTQVKLHPKIFVLLTTLVLMAAGLVVRTRLFDATPVTDSAKRDFLVARLRDFIKEANELDQGHPLYLAHFWYGVGGRIEHFLGLHSTEWVARFKEKQVFALEEIIAELVDGAPIPVLVRSVETAREIAPPQLSEPLPPTGRELSELTTSNPERIFVNVTVSYLMEQFDGRTTAEASRIVQPYIGKWMRVGAAINDVQEQGRETQLTLSPKIDSRQTLLSPGRVFAWGASQQWKDQASILKRGDIIYAEGQILRIDPFSVTLVQAEFIHGDHEYGDNPARLKVSFDEHYDQNQIQNITHHRFRVHNPFLPVAQNVQARLINIMPRPKAEIFAVDFPYGLKTPDGDVRQDINNNTLQFFELCTSWVSGTTGELMVGGLDTRKNHPVPMEPDEVWRLQVEVSCANAPVESIFFRLTPKGKTLSVVQIQDVPQLRKDEGLVVAYNGGRYDHKETKDGKIVYRIVRLQLENKTKKTINGIKIKAESFNNLGTIVPQVPLRICHDEHNNKRDGFSLTPDEKEMVDVVERGIGWDMVRLCHPLSLQIATQETDFKMTIVTTAENQSKQQKRLRIVVDDVAVLRCDALKT